MSLWEDPCFVRRSSRCVHTRGEIIKLLTKLAVAAVLSLGLSFGDTVVASGAGPLPGSAEDLTNQLPNAITGSLEFPNGVSMFEIRILNYLDFSAVTVPVGAYAVPDTELFLFNSSGYGVYGNDDISGGDTLSCLPSGSGSNPCAYGRNGIGPTSNGIYYLAITRSANGPLSGTNEIFLGLVAGAAAGPDLNAGAVDGYDNGVYTQTDFDNVRYQIDLTGTAPEPATWALMGLAGLVLMVVRRRKVTVH